MQCSSAVIVDTGAHRAEEQEELRAALRAPDKNAWSELLRHHGPALQGYATRLLGNRASAEEVVQEALLGVFRNIDSFEGRSSIKSWLFKAVHNRAIDELRRRKRFVYGSDEDPDKDLFNADGKWADPPSSWEDALGAQLDARQLVEIVRKELDTLPHAHREVLLLKEVDGMNTHDICDTLDISPGNLRIRLHRARKVLRAAVDRTLKEG